MSNQAPVKKDNVVYQLVRQSRCHNCDTRLDKGAIAKLISASSDQDERQVLCQKCAHLDTLEFLPTGNTKFTQLAKKLSKQHYIVMRWSELWKTYVRQGLLLETAAIDQAEAELKVPSRRSSSS